MLFFLDFQIWPRMNYWTIMTFYAMWLSWMDSIACVLMFRAFINEKIWRSGPFRQSKWEFWPFFMPVWQCQRTLQSLLWSIHVTKCFKSLSLVCEVLSYYTPTHWFWGFFIYKGLQMIEKSFLAVSNRKKLGKTSVI